MGAAKNSSSVQAVAPPSLPGGANNVWSRVQPISSFPGELHQSDIAEQIVASPEYLQQQQPHHFVNRSFVENQNVTHEDSYVSNSTIQQDSEEDILDPTEALTDFDIIRDKVTLKVLVLYFILVSIWVDLIFGKNIFSQELVSLNITRFLLC